MTARRHQSRDQSGRASRAPLDLAAIKADLRLAEVAQAIVPGLALKKRGGELWGLSPFKAERTPSFVVNDRKGTWYDFSSGQGGDAIRLVEAVEGCDFRGALDKLRTLGLIAPHLLPDGPVEETPEQRRARERRAEAYRQSQIDLARREMEAAVRKMVSAREVWRASVPAAGTLVEVYLRHRGIDCDALKRLYGWTVPPSLRFMAACPYRWDDADQVHPAMVGALAIAPGQALTGVHRTYLAADGRGKAAVGNAKLMLGAARGSLGLLTPVCAQAIVGEGYETTLTVLAALARQGRRVCAMSAGSLGNLAGGALEMPAPARRRGLRGRPGAVPLKLSTRPDPADPGLVLPAGIREVTILADNDGADPAGNAAQVERAAAKFRAAGVAVRIAWPPRGSDFNDLVKGRAA